ncbi:pantoate kinase [Halopenitus sp. H-Gu1]|uniref:pantoate kinase n=1 Tax=Halopenitus sp. H-Gu1 TaxID=3242697 RepID=UPI00359EEBDF
MTDELDRTADPVDPGDPTDAADRADSNRDVRSRAFVPGHVTGFFSPYPDDNSRAAGSRGAGIALEEGVEVSVEPSDDGQRSIHSTLNGDPTRIEPVESVLAELDVQAHVEIETTLPVGAGFGVSGAAALGTALAANDAFGCGRSENDLIAIAHVAEVEAGTGLGDVVAEARGGIPIRLEPGAPGYGSLDGVPANARVEYVSFGELSTASILSEDTAGLSAAGERALSTLQSDSTLPVLFETSRTFAREAGLLVPEVAEAIDLVEAAGGEAAMGMLGRTVIALDAGLSEAGYDPDITRVHPGGARLR